jgi:putative chitinase
MNFENLKGHIPDSVIAELPSVVERFYIDTPIEMAHFIGQCYVESGAFQRTAENMHYTSAGRLVQIFKTSFASEKDKIAKANTLLRNPEALGNFVYSKIGGYKFRGRGYIQLTGIDNYIALQRAIPAPDNVVTNPDLVATKYPMFSAGYYFGKYSLGKATEITPAAIRAVTATINRGLVDLELRVKMTNHFYRLLK